MKRIVSLFMIVLLVFGLVGCASYSETDNKSYTTTSSSRFTPVETIDWEELLKDLEIPSYTTSTTTTTTTKRTTSTRYHSENNDTIVYITKTGECYHEINCGSLWKSCIPISLEDAVARGYRYCLKCDPPLLY